MPTHYVTGVPLEGRYQIGPTAKVDQTASNLPCPQSGTVSDEEKRVVRGLFWLDERVESAGAMLSCLRILASMIRRFGVVIIDAVFFEPRGSRDLTKR